MSNAMTAREQAAFAAGNETAQQIALITAMTIETRNGSGIVRDRTAVAALQGPAGGLKVLMLEPPSGPAHCFPVVQNNGTEADSGRGAGS